MRAITINTAATRFLLDYEELVKTGHREPATLYNHRQALRILSEYVEDRRLIHTVGHAEIGQIFLTGKNRRTGELLSPSTYRKIHSCLRYFWDWCIKRGYADIQPFDRVAKPRRSRHTMGPIPSREQVEILKANLAGVYRDVFILFLQYGRRAGELLRNKRRSWRAVTYVPPLVPVERQIEDEKNFGDLLFYQGKVKRELRLPIPSNHGGDIYRLAMRYRTDDNRIDFRISYDDFYQVLTRTNHAIESEFREAYPDIEFIHADVHCLRRYFANSAIEAGESVEDVAAMLGHTSTSIVLRDYAHLLHRGRSVGFLNRRSI